MCYFNNYKDAVRFKIRLEMKFPFRYYRITKKGNGWSVWRSYN